MNTATGAPRTTRVRPYKPPSNFAKLEQIVNPGSHFWREQATDAHDLLVTRLTKDQANAWHALWIASSPAARSWIDQHGQITNALEAAVKLDPRDPNYVLELAHVGGILNLEAAKEAAADALDKWTRLASNPRMYPEPIEKTRKAKDRAYEIVAEIALAT